MKQVNNWLNRYLIACVSLFILSPLSLASNQLYQQYSKEAQNIYQSMTLDERIGQLLMPSYILLAQAVSPDGSTCSTAVNTNSPDTAKVIKACGLDQIARYHLGAVLSGGGPYYNAPTLKNWAELNLLAQSIHSKTVKKDPILLTGNDAIHGNMHVQGAVIFPHNMGLGATHDAELIQQIGHLVGQDSLASGFNWVFMPTSTVAQDLRWGRTYESFSQDTNDMQADTRAYIRGFQTINNGKLMGPLATAKHYLGDGATLYGLDEGDDAYAGSQATFWATNGVPFESAVEADVGSIMVSYSAIEGNKTRMHFGGKWNIINQFKSPEGIHGSNGKVYQFLGFMVSDWNGPTRAAFFYDQANKTYLNLEQTMAKSINPGIDMLMLGQGDNIDPFDANSPPSFTSVGQVFDAVKSAYTKGLITEQRLQDAVTRILAVKLAMAPQEPNDYAALQSQQRNLALTAAKESLVLLKNDKRTLPLSSNGIENLIFIGQTDDLGLQNGGWTVNWQGQEGDQYFTGADKTSSGATTLEAGIIQALNGKNVKFYHVNTTSNALPAHIDGTKTVAISLISEVPYAEYMGDIANDKIEDKWYRFGATNNYNLYLKMPQSNFLGLNYTKAEADAIQKLREQGVKIITVAYSGRPLVLTQGKQAPLNVSDALIAAFLPGTLGGQALADAIFGQYAFRTKTRSNTLSFPWPRDMKDIENHFKYGSLFPAGYGLSYQ